MLANLTGWHALIILAIVLLVFGSAKLPALAKGVGQSMRILREEVHSSDTDGTTDTTATDTTATDTSATDTSATTRLVS